MKSVAEAKCATKKSTENADSKRGRDFEQRSRRKFHVAVDLISKYLDLINHDSAPKVGMQFHYT